MDEFLKHLNEYFVLLLQLVADWLRTVAVQLGQWGVPEAYCEVGALGVLYLLVTLLVALFILLLLRLGRKKQRPPLREPVKPAAEAPAEIEPEQPPVATEVAPVSLFERMRLGLSKTQNALVGRIDSLLRGSQRIDADLLENLEEILVTADFGVQTTQDLIQSLEQRAVKEDLAVDALRGALQEEIR
jgi:fused signal recognition particle receptor